MKPMVDGSAIRSTILALIRTVSGSSRCHRQGHSVSHRMLQLPSGHPYLHRAATGTAKNGSPDPAPMNVDDSGSELKAASALVLDDGATFHVGIVIDIESEDDAPVIQSGGVPLFVSNNPIECVSGIVALDDARHINDRGRVIGVMHGDLVCACGKSRDNKGKRQKSHCKPTEWPLGHVHALHSR